jgi:signal transduction histidine kinase
MNEALRAVPLFSDLSDRDLDRICARTEEIDLLAGTRLFEEGEPGDVAYVIIDGEIEIVMTSSDRDVLLAVRGEGEVIGEMALLHEEPRSATARARTDATLVSISRAALDDLLATSTSAARSLFGILLQRWRDTEAQLRQSERMAQLGTLTAGLAHELNNPAAAARRNADQLDEAVARYGEARAAMAAASLNGAAGSLLEPLLERSLQPAGESLDADPLARSDREREIEDWLTEHGVDDGWQIAPPLVDLALTDDELDGLAAQLDPDALPRALRLLQASFEVHRLSREVGEGAGRISAIVNALKSYAYLDQAPIQAVDIASALDDTLAVLEAITEGIDVRREYAPDLPTCEVYGSELNQVWTHLIHNAVDAVSESGRADGEIVLRAFPQRERVVVEVEDNGTGIPPDIQDRIFDSFFTTKPPGSGTGLGLDVSFGIVVRKHRGDLRLASSEPGRTVFRVELPRQLADAT